MTAAPTTTAAAATADAATFEFLHVERRGPVAIVTLDRPPVNAVNQAMYGEIRDLFGRADELLPAAKVVVLHGEGRHFCAGNDLAEFASLTAANAPGRMRLVRDAFNAIYDCPVPVIAAVHGAAAGTGVAIAASCDLVVCADSARLSVPEVSVGVMGAAKHLARLVPEQVMRRMYFTAEAVPARDLLPYGGITAVVPDDEFFNSALAIAARITRHSRAAPRWPPQASSPWPNRASGRCSTVASTTAGRRWSTGSNSATYRPWRAEQLLRVRPPRAGGGPADDVSDFGHRRARPGGQRPAHPDAHLPRALRETARRQRGLAGSTATGGER